MICHQHKTILIHIPRCAGTSIETWICGQNWWDVEPATKHLVASQARRLYAPWWDEYFKFSIVRHPYFRVRSQLHHAVQFGLAKSDGGSIDFAGYEERYGADVVLEHDDRFGQRDALLTEHHRPGRVFGNILDEELDFVGRYENLATDMAFVRERLGLPKPFDVHVEKSRASETLTVDDQAWIARTYRDDFRTFGYPLPPPPMRQAPLPRANLN